jgi:hypothetical protein
VNPPGTLFLFQPYPFSYKSELSVLAEREEIHQGNKNEDTYENSGCQRLQEFPSFLCFAGGSKDEACSLHTQEVPKTNHEPEDHPPPYGMAPAREGELSFHGCCPFPKGCGVHASDTARFLQTGSRRDKSFTMVVKVSKVY